MLGRRSAIAELADDIARIEVQSKRSERRVKHAVAASGTTLTDIYGIGPVIAAMLIGNTGSVDRFANRDRLARELVAESGPSRLVPQPGLYDIGFSESVKSDRKAHPSRDDSAALVDSLQHVLPCHQIGVARIELGRPALGLG